MARKIKEIILPLPSGCTLRCGEGQINTWGGLVRICDPRGNEIVYWDQQEWADESEEVMGAIFNIARMPLQKMLKSLKKTKVVDRCWV